MSANCDYRFAQAHSGFAIEHVAGTTGHCTRPDCEIVDQAIRCCSFRSIQGRMWETGVREGRNFNIPVLVVSSCGDSSNFLVSVLLWTEHAAPSIPEMAWPRFGSDVGGQLGVLCTMT